jgi:HPt (histidine-containing phosphotransfer) domain-containing protein
MTAGASDSDRQRCLAAGMDDFLSKPVKPHDVGAVLARWVAEPAPASAEGGEMPSVLDQELLDELRDLSPDGSLLVQIVDTFLATAPDHLAQLRAAVASRDAALTRQSAHRLRGESSALGAVDVARLCATLEESAADGLERAPMLASAIESAFTRAARELRALVGAAGHAAGVASGVG